MAHKTQQQQEQAEQNSAAVGVNELRHHDSESRARRIYFQT